MKDINQNEKLLKSLLESGKVTQNFTQISDAINEIISLIERTLSSDLIFCIIYDKKGTTIYSNKTLNNNFINTIHKQKNKLEEENIIHFTENIKSLGLKDLILYSIFDKETFLGILGLGRKDPKKEWGQPEKLYLSNIANVLGNLIVREQEKKKIIDKCEEKSRKMIHDIRNILQMITISAEQGIIRKEQKNKYFERIIATSEKGQELTKNYLSIKNQKVAREIASCNITDILLKTCDNLRKMAGNDLALESSIEENLPPIKGDSFTIEQIIRNILNNAYQAIKGKGYIRISAKNEQDNVVVTVIDSGPGVSKETANKIFEPHFSTKEGSTGLGLSFVKQEIENLGGEIKLIQKPHCGAIFVLKFPKATKILDIRVITIFLVEDEERIRSFIEELLKQRGYKVITAENFRDAAAMITDIEQLDYLITDINLPDGKGTKIARLLKEKFPDLKIIFITGQPSHTLPAFEGAQVLTKPFHSQDLLSLLP